MNMPTEILMPALSPTMEEGKLAKWLVKEGQNIKAGDIIAEIETDKATMEVEASEEGQLGRILVPEGTEGVKVNTPIALLLGEGESAGAGVDAKGAATATPRPSAPRASTPRASTPRAAAPSGSVPSASAPSASATRAERALASGSSGRAAGALA